MTTKLFALVLLCLMTGAAMAQQAKVTPLMLKELTDNPGKEVLMITVGLSSRFVGPDPPTQCPGVCLRPRRLHCDAGEGWKRGDADTWRNLL
jgi:hypothetical protein